MKNTNTDEMKIIVESETELFLFAKCFSKLLHGNEVLYLHGELGAGKTTFVKKLAAQYGISSDDVLSPTFVLQRKYNGQISILHYDFYRLEEVDQLPDILFLDGLEENGLKIVEWANLFPSIRDKADYILTFEPIGDTKRSIVIEKIGLNHD